MLLFKLRGLVRNFPKKMIWTKYAAAAMRQPSEDPPLIYDCNLSLMTYNLRKTFLLSDCDSGTQEFLDQYCSSPATGGCCKHTMCNALRCFFSVTDTNAILNRGQMHVLSAGQIKRLLLKSGIFQQNDNSNSDESSNSTKVPSVLDIGAGDGNVTEKIIKAVMSTFTQEQENTENSVYGNYLQFHPQESIFIMKVLEYILAKILMHGF